MSAKPSVSNLPAVACPPNHPCAEPCLFGLYTLVALSFADLPKSSRRTSDLAGVTRVKPVTTFSDVIALVRTTRGRLWVLHCPRHATALQELSPAERRSLIQLIAPGY